MFIILLVEGRLIRKSSYIKRALITDEFAVRTKSNRYFCAKRSAHDQSDYLAGQLIGIQVLYIKGNDIIVSGLFAIESF